MQRPNASLLSLAPSPLPRAQVLGVEALHTREVRNTHTLLAQHLQYIRAMPLLERATAVMSFESNLAFESQHLLHHLHTIGFPRWVSLAEGQHQTLGWLTTAGRKESMALLLREALRVGKISYSPHFFSISMTKLEAKKRVGEELRNFSCITEPGRTHFAKVSIPLRPLRVFNVIDVVVCRVRRRARRTQWVNVAEHSPSPTLNVR